MVRFNDLKVYDMQSGILVGQFRYGKRWQFEPQSVTAFDEAELQAILSKLKAIKREDTYDH